MTPTTRPYLVDAGHIPTVAEQRDNRWGVYCHACSQAAEDYVWPCREGVDWDVPAVLVAADGGNSVADPQLCTDKNGFHDAHDWRPDPSGALVECPGYPVPHVVHPDLWAGEGVIAMIASNPEPLARHEEGTC